MRPRRIRTAPFRPDLCCQYSLGELGSLLGHVGCDAAVRGPDDMASQPVTMIWAGGNALPIMGGLGLPRHRWGPAVKTRLITPDTPDKPESCLACLPCPSSALYTVMAGWSLPTHKRVRSAPRRSPSNQRVMPSFPTVPAIALDASQRRSDSVPKL